MSASFGDSHDLESPEWLNFLTTENMFYFLMENTTNYKNIPPSNVCLS